MLTYRSVHQSDYRFLYRLLKERNKNINISHRKIPSYAEHVRFCQSGPYYEWRIIEDGKRKIGHWYLTRANEIGIFVAKKHQRRGIGVMVLDSIKRMKLMPSCPLLANINPRNKRSISLFTKAGFKHIQNTYRLIAPRTGSFP